jgi:signal recognition particle subunit SRP54
MGKNKGMFSRLFGMGGAGPSVAETQQMQAELGRLNPTAIEHLPKELRERLKGLPAGGAEEKLARKLPGLGGALPGLGGAMPKFPGLPGTPGKKK